MKIIELKEVDSTNNFLKRRYENFDPDSPVIVFANYQSGGRGRDKRIWYSEKGRGIYCSIGYVPKNTDNLNFLSLCAGIAVSEYLNDLSGKDFTVKWPNDILYENKKIAGILIENIIVEKSVFSVIGIGINVNNNYDNLPVELKSKVSSLKDIIKKESDIVKIRKKLPEFIFKWLNTMERGDISKIQKKYEIYGKKLFGKKISFHYQNKIIVGIYGGIGKKGQIIVEIDGKTEEFFSGEIQDIS